MSAAKRFMRLQIPKKPALPLQRRAASTQAQWSVDRATARPSRQSELPVNLTASLLTPVNGLHLRSLGKPDMTPRFFDAVWLRDLCQCVQCVNPKTKQKTFGTASIHPKLGIKSSSVEGDCLSVQWTGGHESRYSISDVLSNLQAPALHSGSEAWGEKKMASLVDSGKNCVSYDTWMHDDTAFANMLHSLQSCGLVFVQGVPHDEESVVRLAERIGPLRHTFYGRTWDVKDKPDSQNVAYTATDLELHMDLLYMKQPPGLQLLHCLEDSSEGGLSTFSDAFQAAHVMHSSIAGREAFQTLTSYPVSYHYNHPGKAFYDTKVTFELDNFNNDMAFIGGRKQPPQGPQLKCVNWSPPFQAPFSKDPELPGSGPFRQYLRAAKLFSGLINDPALLFQRRLQPGECVIFNNRRVLHGRTAFTSSGGKERFLKGAYVDTDDFESHLRQRGFLTQNPSSLSRAYRPIRSMS